MNVLLKAMLKEVLDLVVVGENAVAKNYSGLFTALVGAGEDVPAIVANFADLKPELEALLANPAADQDLLAYVEGLVGVGKGAGIINASAKLLLDLGGDVSALVAAIQS